MALLALCPKEEWFSDDLPLGASAKETIERTSGKLLIEAADMFGLGKRDVDKLKSFLSRQVDGKTRMAYAHESIEKARSFIIIGTTNKQTYLKDPTGNRRFLPVRVRRFDLEGIKQDRDQLWAEAAHREASTTTTGWLRSRHRTTDQFQRVHWVRRV